MTCRVPGVFSRAAFFSLSGWRLKLCLRWRGGVNVMSAWGDSTHKGLSRLANETSCIRNKSAQSAIVYISWVTIDIWRWYDKRTWKLLVNTVHYIVKTKSKIKGHTKAVLCLFSSIQRLVCININSSEELSYILITVVVPSSTSKSSCRDMLLARVRLGWSSL